MHVYSLMQWVKFLEEEFPGVHGGAATEALLPRLTSTLLRVIPRGPRGPATGTGRDTTGVVVTGRLFSEVYRFA